jgi:hypothetical protein
MSMNAYFKPPFSWTSQITYVNWTAEVLAIVVLLVVW